MENCLGECNTYLYLKHVIFVKNKQQQKTPKTVVDVIMLICEMKEWEKFHCIKVVFRRSNRRRGGSIVDLQRKLTHRVPTRTGKPGKMGRHFPVRERSGNFEQSGKVRENHTKYWKTRGI